MTMYYYEDLNMTDEQMEKLPAKVTWGRPIYSDSIHAFDGSESVCGTWDTR